jgi:hypothetical protein
VADQLGQLLTGESRARPPSVQAAVSAAAELQRAGFAPPPWGLLAAPRPQPPRTPHAATRCVDGNVPPGPRSTKKILQRFLPPCPTPSAHFSCRKRARTPPPLSPPSPLAPNSISTTPTIAPYSSDGSACRWGLPPLAVAAAAP